MKRARNGTSGSTGGLPSTTWRSPSFKVRVFGFALAVAALASVIVRIDSNILEEQKHLQEGFEAIKAEKFYFGVNFRVGFRRLHAALLDFHLTGSSADLEAFHRDGRELKDWLRARENVFAAPEERQALTRLEAAYDEFLARVDPPQQASGLPPAGREGFAAAYAQIREDSQPLLRACDEVVEAEHRDFDVFLGNSDRALASLQRAFLLSLVLLIGLAAALAVLVYRGMIGPLRAKLSESQTIIERQEKLASLGVLGAGVAHEIRNPLTAIKFRLFSLKKSLPAAFSQNEDVAVISAEINRLDRIVKDFLLFARPSEPDLIRIPAARILEEVCELLKSQLSQAGVELNVDIAQPEWIEADTQQLKQVLINLIQNSADSIEERGTITLRLKAGAADLNGHPGRAAILAVTDTGKGIPPEARKRLFDPFFTTKEGGTGLGLAIAARIVEKHGGLLRYKTEVNRGTTFEIVLPATGDHASENTAH